jgi:demethylmenaquinone methyltransferase/2-methoxy-6-polyprenyl-1,4-benzoquinol methylase
VDVPERVRVAEAGAREAGFGLSCDARTGGLLAVLATAVPSGGRILELGTGAGVGLSWIVEGLGGRGDVEVVSVEADAVTAEVANRLGWPDGVRIVVGDALAHIDQPGRWDLVFADAQGGKWEGLADTVRSVRPGGMLLVDDMTPAGFMDDEHREKTAEVRAHLLASPHLTAVEIGWSTGLILCSRRRDEVVDTAG